MIKHLAFIMDGNRRWARKQGLSTLLGHRNGAEAIQHVVEFCIKKRIQYTSLYTFSIENFSRSAIEVSYLFDLLTTEAQKKISFFLEKGIRVRFVGDRSLFPESVKAAALALEEATASGTILFMNILFCYGSRQEILGGIRKVVQQVKDGLIALEDVSEDFFKKYLWTAEMPEPELIIRTGGCKRLSNFLLYQAAYSELCFLDCLWPDITQDDMDAALNEYIQTKRNFGQ